jgi:hypothetical protein
MLNPAVHRVTAHAYYCFYPEARFHCRRLTQCSLTTLSPLPHHKLILFVSKAVKLITKKSILRQVSQFRPRHPFSDSHTRWPRSCVAGNKRSYANHSTDQSGGKLAIYCLALPGHVRPQVSPGRQDLNRRMESSTQSATCNRSRLGVTKVGRGNGRDMKE